MKKPDLLYSFLGLVSVLGILGCSDPEPEMPDFIKKAIDEQKKGGPATATTPVAQVEPPKAVDPSADDAKSGTQLGSALGHDLVYSYNPVGKRDPFLPPPRVVEETAELIEKPVVLSPLQNYALKDLRVSGIIWGIPTPVAIIQTPDGQGFTVEEGALIGKNWGRVSYISDVAVMVEEEFRDAQGKLHKETKEMTLKEP